LVFPVLVFAALLSGVRAIASEVPVHAVAISGSMAAMTMCVRME
jgi:hypothetical protein